MTSKSSDRERIRAEAADWVTRQEAGRLSKEEKRAFEHWLLEDEAHRRAYDFATDLWTGIGALGEAARARHLPAAPPVRHMPHWQGIAAMLCLVAAGLCLTLLWHGDPRPRLLADHYAAPGSSMTVTLADGSIVELGSDSALALGFSAGERRVRLLSGRAYFTAAPKTAAETRPFVVEAGGGTATALGTQFAVERLDGDVEVTVAEHQVRVDLESGSDQRLLSPGESLLYAGNGARFGALRNVDVESRTAWRRGRIIFDTVPLGDVIAELNRYRRGRIVIANPALAGLTVSGVFEITDLQDALRRIVAETGVRQASLPPLVTIIY